MGKSQYSSAGKSTRPIRAAEYVRMSTDHQQYSTENQQSVIRQWAEERNRVIARTYADEDRSGLSIEGRQGLQRLLQDVQRGQADFSEILVYDVSRWGRFQDADESAHYEYLCRRANIAVHYCAEQFENDGTQISAMFKGMKRVMAAEYSRELSAKVFLGQCRLIRLGFRQGGTAGYGLRRQLQDQHGAPKAILTRGERKSIQTDRVILVPGPPEELQTIRSIYRMFVEDSKSEAEIARLLNEGGSRTDFDRLWTRGTVHQVLTNEKYAGHNVYNRMSFKLKQKRVKNPPEAWVRRDEAFTPVIPTELFRRVQEIIWQRSRHWNDDELLDHLRQLLTREGKLSGLLIDETEGMASSSVYRHRFQSLVRAYQLIGYAPERDYQFIEVNRQLRVLHPKIIADVTARLQEAGGKIERDCQTDILTINGELTASIVIARCHSSGAGAARWVIRFDAGLKPDITIAVRMDSDNREPLDYYLLPLAFLRFGRLRLSEDNGVGIDTYRFATLDFFVGMARRTRLEEAA
jgi:DNA invertase Pin-like site-specific DNA recombinase